MAGTGLAVALVPAGPWGLAALVPLTGAAFAAETRGPRAATATLAVVYAYAFTLFFEPDPAWAIWHLAAAATGGLTALAVLLVRTPLDRPATRRQLAASHAAALSLFLDDPGRTGALERMRMTARAAEMALATGLALLLGNWVSPDRWAWSYIAAVFLFTGTPSMGHVFVRGWSQLRGTVVGVVLGLAVAAVVQGQQAAGVVALVALQVLYLHIRARHQLASVAVITAWLGVLFGLTGDPVGPVLLLRIEEILAGAAAGFVAARFVRPHATEAQVRAEAAALLHGLAETVRTPGAPRAVDGRLGDALAALRDTSAPRAAPFARPGRRVVGRRFALMERAVHFTHLLRLADRFGESPTPTEAATQERLADMASELAHAVSAGRAPRLPPFSENDFAADGLRGRALRGLNDALRELAWGVGG